MFRVAAIAQCFLELANGLEIFSHGRRVKGDDVRWRFQGVQVGLQLAALALQAAKCFGAGDLGQHGLDQQIYSTFVFGLDGQQPPFDALALGNGTCGKLAALLIVEFDVGRQCFAATQALLKTVQDGELDAVEVKRLSVRAGRALLCPCALNAHPAGRAVLYRHPGSAAAAFQKAREQMLVSAVLPCLARAQRPVVFLDLGKGFAVDDREMRRGGTLPFLRRIWAGHTLAGVRVLDHGDAIPDDFAAV